MANILLVDDDTDLARAVGKSLKLEDHTVTVVNSGPEGWNTLKTNNYDLVILDWEMPDLNGIEILKLLRSTGDTTPVIMLTGRANLDDKLQGLDTGANDYLTKPFETDELLARIRATLRSKAAAAPPPKPLGENNEHILRQANLAGTAVAARFEFLDVIGEGGVALVFRARHPQLDKLVAIKMLQDSELVGETIARFESEARIISKLDHQNIVTVYDFGVTENKQPYMVMELIDGPSLHDHLDNKGSFPLKEALPILLATCDGLAHAHEHGILHRDIKPGNIMLKQIAGQSPVPKILDFGLAKLQQANAQKAAYHTQARQIMGSPPYMSPEQVRGTPADERSDVYSLGCLIFETVTGYPAFVGDDPLEITCKHLEEPPLTFAEVCPDLKFPRDLERLVEKALEREPSKRYQTVRELQEDLSRVSPQAEDKSIWSQLRKLKPF